jgi:hypothetical protein
MACGDAFRHLAVTASGLSFDNPFDDIATNDDFEEWKELARKLGVQAQHDADDLSEVEFASIGAWNRWNIVNDRKTAAITLYDDLPEFYIGSHSVKVAEAQAAVLEFLCVIELARNAIKSYGGTPDVLPGTPNPKENDGILTATGNLLTTVVVVGGIVVGGVFLANYFGRR